MICILFQRMHKMETSFRAFKVKFTLGRSYLNMFGFFDTYVTLFL